MKNLFAATLATLVLSTAATAGGVSFSLPNLSFPAEEIVTVGKDCLAPNATSTGCMTQE